MNEQIEEVTEKVNPPVKNRAKQKRKVAKKQEAKPVTGGEFAGISATSCCDGCTAERCVISTVAVCKHPYKTADNGCGPVTMKNRFKARRLLKHQMIDLTGG